MKSVLMASLLMSLADIANCQTQSELKPSYVSEQGFVLDAATALRIAKAVLVPKYGAATINAEEPFVATLRDGVWTVVGTLPIGLKGGVAKVEISQTSGAILNVMHGK